MLRRFLEYRRRRALEARGLFCFRYEGRLRAVDPYAIQRALVHHPDLNLERDAPFIDAGHEPETTQFMQHCCELFGVQRFDSATGRGATDAELQYLFLAFQEYLAALKKNGDPGPSSPPATASTSSTSPADPAAVENAGLDSGSAESTSSGSTP